MTLSAQGTNHNAEIGEGVIETMGWRLSEDKIDHQMGLIA
jgi:hypothetical protein